MAQLVGEFEPLSETVANLRIREVLGIASMAMTERCADLAPEGTRSTPTKLVDSASRSGHVIAFNDRRKTA